MARVLVILSEKIHYGILVEVDAPEDAENADVVNRAIGTAWDRIRFDAAGDSVLRGSGFYRISDDAVLDDVAAFDVDELGVFPNIPEGES